MTTTELRAYLDALDEGRLEWKSAGESYIMVPDVQNLACVIANYRDLRIAPKPEPVKELWMNVYNSGCYAYYSTYASATTHAFGLGALDTLHITYDPNTRSAKVEVVGKENPASGTEVGS